MARRNPLSRSLHSPLLKYTLLQIPGWLVLGYGLTWLRNAGYLSGTTAVVVFLAWVIKDAAVYPLVRKAFAGSVSPAPGEGETGIVVEALNPCGYVRVQGELWKARLREPGPSLGARTRVRVEERQGLLLIVSPEEKDRRNPL